MRPLNLHLNPKKIQVPSYLQSPEKLQSSPQNAAPTSPSCSDRSAFTAASTGCDRGKKKRKEEEAEGRQLVVIGLCGGGRMEQNQERKEEKKEEEEGERRKPREEEKWLL